MAGENGEGLRAHLGNIRDSINVPASLIATGVSLVAMNAAIYIPGWGEDTAPGTLRDAGTVENTTTTDVVVGRSTRTFHKHTTDKQPVDSMSGSSEFELKSGSQVYAEEFSADPDAGEFSNPKSLDSLVGGIKKLIKSDAEITSITITGYSSAEDDNPDGGFSEASDKNIELAQKRADTVANDLRERLAEDPQLAKATRDIDIRFGEPNEQRLTPEQQDSLENQAKLSGFSSAKQLVESWNDDPSSVSPSSRQYLDALLGNQRKVTADIGWRRQGKDIYSLSDYCTRFIVTNLETQEKKDKDQIPVVPYFLPIVIPRRRKKPGSSSDEGPFRPEFSPQLRDAVEGKISKEDYLARGTNLNDRYTGLKRLLGLAASRLPKRSNKPDVYQDSKAEKVIRRAVLGTILGALGLVACINVTGRDCDGDVHLPRPFLIDGIWDAIDGNPDAAQQTSLGVPFVDSLQLFRSDWALPTFSLSGNPYEEVCHDDGGSSQPGGSLPAPKCSTVRIVKKDGTIISQNVIYNAGPFKTRTVVEKTK